MELGSIFENAKELDKLRKDQEECILEINKIHKKLSQSAPEAEKTTDAIWYKLRALYVQAKDLAENEATLSDTLGRQLDALMNSGPPTAQRKKLDVDQKKKRLKADSENARTSSTASRGLIEQAQNLIGEQVAARVTLDNAEKDEWFVVKVTRFDRETKEYEVLDEDPGDDEESVQRKYKLPMSRIIPFPKRNEPTNAPDFPIGRQVLAVYPGTTALYKATVCTNRKRKADDYVLEFDDDEEEGAPGLPQRQVPFHRVVPLPEGHRQ